MSERTMGETIAALRKERGMTQKDLARQMNVTDKAVSKWERDLSCPDIGSIPRLAQVLGVGVEELLNAPSEKTKADPRLDEIINTICKALPLALGVAVAALTAMNAIDVTDAVGLLGLGMSSIGIYLFRN